MRPLIDPPLSSRWRAALRLVACLAMFVGAPGVFAAPAAPTAAAPETIAASAAPTAQAASRYRVSLVTVGPGAIYWERFGHNAILIEDRERGVKATFNYGIFDFEQENFFLNFLRGEMRYRLAAFDADEDIAGYIAEGRAVDLQTLNLSAAQAQALVDFLRDNLRPENREYRYDYFTANCSTRVRDALDRALGGQLYQQLSSPSRGFTYRAEALRLTAPDFWLARGIHAGLGPYADRPISYWEEDFVPMEFARHLRELRVDDGHGGRVALVGVESRLAESTVEWPAEEPPFWLPGFAGFGLGVAALLLMLARRAAADIGATARVVLGVLLGGWWLVCGLGGVLLAFLWACTAHQSAWANQNLMLLNPLAIALLPLAWRVARGRAASAWMRRVVAFLALAAVAALLAKTLPNLRQQNLDWVLLALPVHLGAWWILRRPDPA